MTLYGKADTKVAGRLNCDMVISFVVMMGIMQSQSFKPINDKRYWTISFLSVLPILLTCIFPIMKNV